MRKFLTIAILLSASVAHATWTAKVLKKDDTGTTLTVTFQFISSDAPDKPIEIVQGGFLSDDQINGFARNQIAAYNKKVGVTIKDGDTLDLTLPPPPPPPVLTQDQKDRIAYQKLASKYRSTKAAVALGILEQGDLDKIIADLITTYKEGYEDYLAGI